MKRQTLFLSYLASITLFPFFVAAQSPISEVELVSYAPTLAKAPSQANAAEPAAAETYTVPQSFFDSQGTSSGATPTASPTPSATPVAAKAPVPMPEQSTVPAAIPEPVPEPSVNTTSSALVINPPVEPEPHAGSPFQSAGYDGGFFIKDKDGKFGFTMNGRIQPRYAFNLAEDIEDKHSFIVRRITFVWGGFIIDPKLTWEFVFIPAATPPIGEAIVTYTFMPEFALTAGYVTIPTVHSNMESSGKLIILDSSLAENKFGVGDSVGLLATGTIGKLYYAGGVFNGAATDLSRNENTELAYGLQLGYNILGMYGSGEADVGDSPTPNWVFDVAGNFHHEETGTQAKVVHGGAFTGLKWQGFAMQLEGNVRYIDPDQFTREQVDVGYTAKAAYFLVPKKFEIALRHSALLDDINDVGINQNMTAGNIGALGGQHIAVDVNGDSDNEYEFSGGLNYYFVGHTIKMQAQYSYIIDGIPGADNRVYHVGILQGQVGF